MTPYLSQRREELIRTYRDGLLRDVIPFWMKHGLDRVNGVGPALVERIAPFVR